MNCIHPLKAWPIGINEKTGKSLLSFAPCAGEPVLLPCGKCSSCLQNRRRDWFLRLSLEAASRRPLNSSFLTLTYQHAPEICIKSHVQNFLKKFRNLPRDRKIPIQNFKYFCAAEYGEKFGRPHYHIIMFGVNLLDDLFDPYISHWSGIRPFYSSRVLEKVWNHGFIDIAKLSHGHIGYCANYILSDNSPWYIFSKNLGRDFYFDKNALVFKDNYLSILNTNHFHLSLDEYFPKSYPIGRVLDSTLKRFAIDDYENLRLIRKNYMVGFGDSHTISSNSYYNRQKIQKRKKNNEKMLV